MCEICVAVRKAKDKPNSKPIPFNFSQLLEHSTSFTELAIIKAEKWLEREHMQETNWLANKMDEEETHKHPAGWGKELQ